GARPSEAQWFSFVSKLERLHRQESLDLVAIDPLATLLPSYAETCAAKMLDCLLPLQELAHLGPAVWLMHHPAKGRRADGQASRGSSALSGFADIVMEMSHCRRARSRDRRRRICSYSRYVETPRHLIVELTADGLDYLVRTDETGTPLVPDWPELQHILGNAIDKYSREEILKRWPVTCERPDRTTLLRWLTRATKQRVLCCSGVGHCGGPFLYWLPERESLLFPGFDASERV